MKKTLLFLICLFNITMYGQCWKYVDNFSGIKTDGSLWIWGYNNFGRYGNGTTSSSPIPLKIGSDTWLTVSCSMSGSTYGIKSNGSLWAWGANHMGELGIGPSTSTSVLFPTQIGTDTNWKTISSNYYHTLAIKTDGTLWSWGQNDSGAVGDGTIISRNTPVQIGTDTNWEIVCAGQAFSMAIKTNGSLWTWGFNAWGQLGNGTNVDSLIPIQIGTDTNWVSIFANHGNSSSAYALKSDGTIWSWGQNTFFELGDGTIISKNIPTKIGNDNDWTAIGERMAVKSNGTLWGWGQNSSGLLGDGTRINRPVPTQIGVDTDWATPTKNVVFKLKTDGTLWANGKANYVGIDDTDTFTLIPLQVASTNCPSIIANNDSGTALNGLASTPIANVLTDDTFNGNPATFSNVTLSFISSTHSGITLNTSTGSVNVSATVPIGTYTLNYQICQSTSLSNCDTATVTITVNPQTIDAVNDNFSGTPIDYLTGGVTPSLLTNDIVNGAATNPAEVILTLTNNGGVAGASINANGGINIPVGTLMNTYTLQYSICLISNPSICDTASVTVTVADRVITTPEIVFAIRANNVVDQSQLQSTGKIIISGGFTKYNNVDARYLMRLNTDLTYDTTFPALGSSPHEPEDFKVLPNDKIIVVGTFTSINGTSTPRGIARLNADGTVDTSFNVGGTGIDINSRIISCAVQSDGKILLGGGFIFSYNGATTRNMIRLNSDGTLDTSFMYPYTFNPNRFGSIHKIVLQPDGKILVTGNNSMSVDAFGNAIGQPHIFRLNSDGSLDSTFTTTFLDSSFRDPHFCSSCINPIQNMVLQPDGKIIIVGTFVNFHDVRRRNNIVRLNSDGTLDTNFQASRNGTTSNRAIKDAVVEPSGKIIIGGEFTTYNGATANKLVRLNADGTVDATFSSGDGPIHPINSSGGTVFDLNRQADGKVIVSGSFSHYNNISATNITRIAPEIPGSQARGNGIQLWNTEKEIENSFQATGEISIYPNPSTGIFTFDLTQTKEKFAMITIYNALGQEVYQKNSIPETVNEIDLSNLPDGYYYAQITGDNSNVQKVLIKK